MPQGADHSRVAAELPWEQTDLLGFAAAALAPEAEPDSNPELRSAPLSQPEAVSAALADDAVVAASAAVASGDPATGVSVAAGAVMGDGAALPGCPRRLLILDTETTGLDPNHDQCIEVGAVLFDVAHRSVLSQISFLLPCTHNDAEAVNGIAVPLTQVEQPWPLMLQCFEAMLTVADVVVAHNAAFDRQWFGQGPLPEIDKPWLCSMDDLRWPADRGLRSTPSVRDLALAYGVPVWAAHRALTDCIYLAQVFERCEPLEALLREGLEPRQLYRARLSYEERHKAKQAGFRWNEPVSGAWSRRLSEREVGRLPFPVVPVEDREARRSA